MLPAMTPTLQDYFNSLLLDDIKAFVKEAREEDLQLEFKRVEDPELGREQRKTFARAVSGFGNSDGGLIVWGVDARKKDEIDCACDAPGIAGVKRFLTK